MPRFKITTRHPANCNGIRIEPGMSVEIVSQYLSNPVTSDGGKQVADAFMRVYGIDLKKAGCLNSFYLDVKRLG